MRGVPLINDIGEEEDVSLINNIGEENVHTELMEEEEEEVSLIR